MASFADISDMGCERQKSQGHPTAIVLKSGKIRIIIYLYREDGDRKRCQGKSIRKTILGL